MSAHLAVAIVADTPDQALELVRSLPHGVSLVEYRLDFMNRVDVDRLARRSRLPAIFTCRPQTQGGRFRGSERERQDILRQALKTNHLVDIEMDALPAMRPFIHDPVRVIGSWHDFGGMLGDWGALSTRIRGLGAGVAKLVGMAATEDDVLTPCAWLHSVSLPSVGIAMGAAGAASRLLAPRFASALLTFASLDQASAPGQIHVQDMIAGYGFSYIADAAPFFVLLTPDPASWDDVERYRRAMLSRATRGRPWLLPIPASTLHPGLALALRMARASGVIRLPGVETSPLLSNYGLSPDALAWRLPQNSKPEALAGPSSPDAIITFLLQGN